MTMAAVAIGGSALIGLGGAYMGAKAQKDAARTEANNSQALFAQQQALNAPYMYAGNAAANPLFALYGINSGLATSATSGPGQNAGGAATPEQQKAAMDMFYQSPEYTVQKGALDQAQQRQAAAQGMRYSGNAALGSAEIAGRTFGDWRNNLATLAQMGPTGAGIQGNNLTNLTSGLNNSAMNMGNANANAAGAYGQTAQDALGQFSNYKQYQDRTSQLAQMYNPAPQQNWSNVQIPDYTSGGINF